MYEIADALREEYRDFSHDNKRNPFNELVFILCTVKTTRNNYARIYRSLRREFPTAKALQEASFDSIESAIRQGGLSRQRAKAIKGITDALVSEFGEATLSPLRRMPDHECEVFLTSLPRVGKKVARCVMLYSLGRKVFPVDTHCWRISLRLGWMPGINLPSHCREKDMDYLQDGVPEELRFTLHVNMISLGRKRCTPTAPRCTICPINVYCKSSDHGGSLFCSSIVRH